MVDVNGPLSGFRTSYLIVAILKRAGHEVLTVTLSHHSSIPYTREQLLKLKKIVDQIDLVMISTLSVYAIRALDITRMIKEIKPNIKVIWGGSHCFAEPELSVKYADIVCYGEGDLIVSDLVDRIENGRNYIDIPNIAFKENGRVRVNETIQPITDLDALPYCDCELSTHYVLTNDLFKMTEINIVDYFDPWTFHKPSLAMLTMRGCPHRCSYCNNSRYIKLFGKSAVRRRSVTHFTGEIKKLLKVYTCCTNILFADDDFLLRSVKELQEFAEIHKGEIKLPFSIEMSPNTFNAEKLDILADAGLKLIEIGVQSASERVLKEIYHRHVPIEKVRKVIQYFDSPAWRYHKIDVYLDFLLDNPYETQEDIYKTLRFILDVPNYFWISKFTLSFFPGTPLYDRAIKDGIIEPNDYKSFRRYRAPVSRQKNYVTWLIKRYPAKRERSRFVRYLFRILGSKIFFHLGSKFISPLYAFVLDRRATKGLPPECVTESDRRWARSQRGCSSYDVI
jgi:radical SAM superfamily enzyme YgiQ (UPF0313 family)